MKEETKAPKKPKSLEDIAEPKKNKKKETSKEMKEETLVIKGRHDPCVVLRAVPVVESCAAIAMLDMML